MGDLSINASGDAITKELTPENSNEKNISSHIDNTSEEITAPDNIKDTISIPKNLLVAFIAIALLSCIIAFTVYATKNDLLSDNCLLKICIYISLLSWTAISVSLLIESMISIYRSIRNNSI